MGFTPDTVGLSGEHITAHFGERRGDCFHRGLDISSSKTPKDFHGGFPGKIVNPISGKWGTISIVPDSQTDTIVQFLHCSRIDVAVGTHVDPGQTLGATGDTAPPGGSEGIHLHIQVVKPGTPMHSCWDRNYVDPETWDGV